MMKMSPFYAEHLALGAQMVPFANWLMPLHYGSQIKEHLAVREKVGLFDVSHMTIIDIIGPNAHDFLRYLLANDVDKLLKKGQALYSCMLNEQGGIIDDLLVYFMDLTAYRLITNAATQPRVLDWLHLQSISFNVKINLRSELAILALQGPQALYYLNKILPSVKIAPFHSESNHLLFISRTGYSGEDGFELIGEPEVLKKYWEKLLSLGVQPCGLGARDTLRIEAGLNLYGQDMDETTLPFSRHLGWTVSFDDKERLFIGKIALLLAQSGGFKEQLVAVKLEGPGVLRSQQKLRLFDGKSGWLTSGTYSPLLKKGIGFAVIPIGDYQSAEIAIRGEWIKADIIPTLRFVAKISPQTMKDY